MLYFAYGSNISSLRLSARIGPVGVHGLAQLPYHEHRFSKSGFDGTGKGNIQPHTTRRVHGVLYELTLDQLEILCNYEGGYRRATLETLALSTQAPSVAITFIGERPGGAPAPSQAYLDHYREGFAEHGFPVEYARAILADGGDPRPFG